MIFQTIKTSIFKLFKSCDLQILTISLILIIIGTAAIYSASSLDTTKTLLHIRNFSIAIFLMVLVSKLPISLLLRLSIFVYFFGLLLLILVEFFGTNINGAKRWLDLGFFKLQPSELMKIGVPFLLAWLYEKFEGPKFSALNLILGSVIIAVPLFFIVRQPDLGTSILIASAGFFVLYLGGISKKIILFLLLIFIVSGPIIWTSLHDYQKERVLILLDPSKDPRGAGYHTIQSSIAVGSGGIAGKGWTEGTQSHLDFLPETTTDFIFAVIGEEFGLLGCTTIIILYLIIIGKGLAISLNAPSNFGRLVSASFTFIIFIYVFVNMGMVIGILPIVGIPLPLISYGGSSAVSIMISLGVIMSINNHRRLVPN